MDVSDSPAKESVMIALIPGYAPWCKTDFPHLTLVYGGLLKDFSPTMINDMAKDTAMLSSLSWEFPLVSLSRETFGDEEKVDVIRFRPTDRLLAMRRSVEHWNKSEYPFNPHVTIGPVGIPAEPPPRRVDFQRLAFCWGSDRIYFKL